MKAGITYENLLYQIRPAFGGNNRSHDHQPGTSPANGDRS